ncbi:RUN and FYVE domain-containing protein 1,Protein RUFY3,RUN and FYVE domain-containing protein 2 [Mytilus coruscus]|uniref:RUN and FYVE domain-containing protein 1,Protein RUFY3,RUN and FYVE domain-containing protein 2 n=1 Tax=Mytilus coruscus TaxID=42192 RepID=A0A6J7ZV61_MYTCO|nr:RUN and FYVE domain-containing protein 1,Protein RUFY3,RUN and FYVE domain-containing protein 2 [Mytilus coruscus]
MAEETIYLCNFRVSVDGDWLCLKELSDMQLEVDEGFLLSPEADDGRDPKTIERANLLNICKLIIKELIDSSLSHGRMLDDDHIPLQQFFVVLEHVLRHGLKPKKGILRDRKDFWSVLESIEKLVPEAGEITTSVREMPHIKTPLGRARAWLRLALMQKTLADYFKVLIEKKDEVLSDFYEPGAMLIEDEGMVIPGLLVGLNVIDCNMCIKEEDLDQPIGVIDFSLYLKDSRLQDSSPDNDREKDSKMATILDQKNYLEELNRHLNATVTNLQQKMQEAMTTNALMKEDLALSKNNFLAIQEENEQLKSDRENITEEHTKQIEQASTRNISDVEKELELQIGMKQEMEMALRILEKDIHEKQDTMISLRKQLEEIKAINLEMYQKLQNCDQSLKHKTELVTKLEEKTNQLVQTLKDMEKAAEETARKLGQIIAEKDTKRTALETDLRIEKEWRATLQKTLEQEKTASTEILTELQQLKHVEKDYVELQKGHLSLQKACEEQERALAELGSHLSESKLRVEDMKEAQMASKDLQWKGDKDASHCRTCEKEFSISRRKHHCRNCGNIFCNECSDNKMPLPSSAKPVRVCDDCQTFLLQRYSAATQ